MKFPAIIPKVNYTSCLEYVLSVMTQKSSTPGAQISSYLLKSMKEKKSNLEFPHDKLVTEKKKTALYIICGINYNTAFILISNSSWLFNNSKAKLGKSDCWPKKYQAFTAVNKLEPFDEDQTFHIFKLGKSDYNSIQWAVWLIQRFWLTNCSTV